MPSCIISNCLSKTGRKGQDKNIILHCFPNTLDRIKDWLLSTGQHLEDVASNAQKIFDEQKSSKYRLCSLHFTEESYRTTKGGKMLLSTAIPSIFEKPFKGEALIDVSLTKLTQLRKRPYALTEMDSTSAYITAYTSGESFTLQNVVPTKISIATQTECTMLNSEIIMVNEPQTSAPSALSAHSESELKFQSTPIMATSISHEYRDPLSSPLKKRPNLPLLDSIKEELDVEFTEYPISTSTNVLQTTQESILTLEGNEDVRDADYIPKEETFDDSELQNVADVLYAEQLPTTPTFSPLTEEEIVSDNKLLVCESMLDILIYKLSCQYSSDCKFPIKSIFKSCEGSGCRITGQCHKGHTFFVMETQPKLRKKYSGADLPEALGLDSPPDLQSIEHAHRLGPQKLPGERNLRPRPVIARYFHWAWKENILSDYRNLKTLQVGDSRILIVQDFSASVSQKRRSFKPICKHLQDNAIPYQLLYPAKLKVQMDGRQLFFEDPAQAHHHFNIEMDDCPA